MMRSVLDTEFEGIGRYIDYSPFAPRFIAIPFADPINGFSQLLVASAWLASSLLIMSAFLIHDCNSWLAAPFPQLQLSPDSDNTISLKILLNIPFPFRHFLRDIIILPWNKMEKEKSRGQGSSPCGLDHLERTGGHNPKQEVIKDT